MGTDEVFADRARNHIGRNGGTYYRIHAENPFDTVYLFDLFLHLRLFLCGHAGFQHDHMDIAHMKIVAQLLICNIARKRLGQ